MTDFPGLKSRRLLRILTSQPLGYVEVRRSGSRFGWSFDSPDIPGLIGGTDDYDPAEAERAARFALESEAEETGQPAPEPLRFEHVVPACALAA